MNAEKTDKYIYREGVPCTRANDTRKHWAQARDAKEDKEYWKAILLIGLAQSRQARKEKRKKILKRNWTQIYAEKTD